MNKQQYAWINQLAALQAHAFELEMRVQELETRIESFGKTVDAAVANAEYTASGSPGMRVPFHGDFAGAQPSVISRLRWWARELRKPGGE